MDIKVFNGKNIPSYILNNCANIETVEISSNVTSIGYGAFGMCKSLQSITLPFIGSGSIDYDTHFGYIFGANSYTNNSSVVPSTLKTVIITNATTIADYAFYGCNTLEYIELNNGITSIGDCAFEAFGTDYNNVSIVIPDTVVYMGADVFVDCTASVYYKHTSAPDSWTEDWRGPNMIMEYWYSETQPTSNRDMYWHYVDGVITPW